MLCWVLLNRHCQDMLFHLKRNHQHLKVSIHLKRFTPWNLFNSMIMVIQGRYTSTIHYLPSVFQQLLLSGLSGFYAQKHSVKLNSHSRIAPETLWLFQTIFPIGSRYLFRGFNSLKPTSGGQLYAVFQGHAAKPSLPRQVAHHRVQRWRSTVVPRTWLNSRKERSSERNSWNRKGFSYTPYHGNPKILEFFREYNL